MQNYAELELVGKGSYGKCIKVRSHLDDGLYVLKKVAFDGSAQAEAESSLREVQVLSSLRHPHIVPYKEFFKHEDGDLCLVMAYCEGGDLFHYIKALRKKGQIMDEEQAWQWLCELLLALQFCHTKKILHRDVKTQNIFLSNNKVHLGDFGLAKQLQRTIEMARTPIGTPYYMAPEIYEEQPYSYKSDVWALGCVMYELLTGKPAFAADNLSRVVIKVIRGNYDPIPNHFSKEIRDVVTSMLCKTVKNRPDATELLQHPSIQMRAAKYMKHLETANPNGWQTWRMGLGAKPSPVMLAQIARSLANGRVSGNGEAGKLVPSQPGGNPILPQSMEDAMTESQLIDGFSLQSLLKEMPAAPGQACLKNMPALPGQQPKPGGAEAMLLGTMRRGEIQQGLPAAVQAALQQGLPAAALPDAWGRFAELQVLQRQMQRVEAQK